MRAALPRAASFGLNPEGAALLERLLKDAGEAVRDSCRGRFSSPVCALAFIYVEEGFPPAVTYVFALTEVGRSALLEEPRTNELERTTERRPPPGGPATQAAAVRLAKPGSLTPRTTVFSSPLLRARSLGG